MMVDRRDEGAREGEGASNEAEGGERWREVVRLLEDNARARTRLEALETALLREARACDVPARLGYVSLEEFTERHLGYGRHAANERCRVSLELASLPQLCAAYEDGSLMFSHVRELTRVATPQTEGAYLAAAAGKTTRQVQQLVSGKRAGDPPDAPPDPALVTHTVVLELGGEAFAMWRRAQQVLEDEVGERLSTDELVMQLCSQAFAPVVYAAARDVGARGSEAGPDRSRGTATPSGTDDAAAAGWEWSHATFTVMRDTDQTEAGSDRSRGTATPPGTDAAAAPGWDRSRETFTVMRDTDQTEAGSDRSRGTAMPPGTDDDTTPGWDRSRGTATPPGTDDAAAPGWDRSRGTATPPRTDVAAAPGSDRARGTDTSPRTDVAAAPGSDRSHGTATSPRTDVAAAPGSDRARGTDTPPGTDVAAAPGSDRARGTDLLGRTRSRGPRLAPPPTLHAVTTCRSCQRATASSVGSAEPLTSAQRDRALCDAIEVGDLDTSDLTRPTLTVPMAIRRKVAIASNHACVVPGCRSRRHLTIHHLRYQAHGGGHTVENCVLACHAHHARLHEGRLRIEGTAPHALDVAWRHPATNEEQDAGAGPWVWRRVPPDPVPRRGHAG